MAPSNQLCCSRGASISSSISSRQSSSTTSSGGGGDMFSFIPNNHEHVLCHSFLFRFKFDVDKEEEEEDNDWRIGICDTLHNLSDIQSRTLADDKAFIVQLARKWSNSACLKDTRPFTISSPTNSNGGTAKIPIEGNSTNSLLRKIIDMNRNSSVTLNEKNKSSSPIAKKEINSIIRKLYKKN